MSQKNKTELLTNEYVDDKLEYDYFFIIEKIGRKISQFGQKLLTDKGFDLTIDQWMVLKKVSENTPITQIEICKSIFKDAPTVTKILDLLAKKNLIERVMNKSDRRKFDIFITNEGIKLVDSFSPTIIEARKQVLYNIPIEDLYVMAGTLNQMSENMDKTINSL
ncbi:MAG: MarR family transcriptional regulator [Candidatus Sericytochromatia bacterium]